MSVASKSKNNFLTLWASLTIFVIMLTFHFAFVIYKQKEFIDWHKASIQMRESGFEIILKTDMLLRSIIGSTSTIHNDDAFAEIKTDIQEFTKAFPNSNAATINALTRIDSISKMVHNGATTDDYLSTANALKNDIAFIDADIQREEANLIEAEKVILYYVSVASPILLFMIFFIAWDIVRKKNKIAEDSASVSVALYESLLKEKSTDQQTGLKNRMSMLIDNEDYHMAIFDIHHFSDIIREYGRKNADDILIGFFHKMKTAAEQANLQVYRYGIDMAAVITKTETDIADFKDACQRIYDDTGFYFFESNKSALRIPIGVSVGISASMNGKQIYAAESALEMAKHNGNGCKVFTENNPNKKDYRACAEQIEIFYNSYQKNRLVPFFQPIVDVQTKKAIKYEGLIRILEEDKIYYPKDFFDGVDFFGLGMLLTESVFLKIWEALEDIDVSMNISAEDINSKQTTLMLFSNMARNPKKASRLTFEILETENKADANLISDFIIVAKSMGAKIAIDDFGTGYSNYERLTKSWGADMVKIDGSLIEAITHDDRAYEAVSSIVQISKKIGIKTVAEFVSSEEIFDMVKHLGVDYAQGFYFGRAVPLEEILK